MPTEKKPAIVFEGGKMDSEEERNESLREKRRSAKPACA